MSNATDAPTPATQTTLADVVAFLTRMLDKDEAAARAAQEWVDLPGFGRTHPALVNRRSRPPHDPARVLADVAARRAIVELHTVLPVRSLPGGRLADGCCTQCTAWGEYGGPTPDGEPNPCDTLRHLAAVYSDSPGYDERWAVS